LKLGHLCFLLQLRSTGWLDPDIPAVPVSERPDIDRWILSDLQLLVQTARREFENFNVMASVLEPKLSLPKSSVTGTVRRTVAALE